MTLQWKAVDVSKKVCKCSGNVVIVVVALSFVSQDGLDLLQEVKMTLNDLLILCPTPQVLGP